MMEKIRVAVVSWRERRRRSRSPEIGRGLDNIPGGRGSRKETALDLYRGRTYVSVIKGIGIQSDQDLG